MLYNYRNHFIILTNHILCFIICQTYKLISMKKIYINKRPTCYSISSYVSKHLVLKLRYVSISYRCNLRIIKKKFAENLHNLSISNKSPLFCLIFCTQVHTYNRTDAYIYELRHRHFDKKTRGVQHNR